MEKEARIREWSLDTVMRIYSLMRKSEFTLEQLLSDAKEVEKFLNKR